MNVKSLKIVGFKSFCSQTEINFHKGLNAIVGPNGCGKSNISDALKWVMGEQNVRNLRGDRLEDIIFSGSRESKPMGMAEVTMIIESNGGMMPPQFSRCAEIEITRRVYRSGDSEYLINKQPCLLKDIREIFMDTGLNPRAYSIIEQGSIMEIVRSSPQELRKMLEEAAGITKYRERKAATERKIKATRLNLDRVSDIILEVERQVRTARRQAGEARRYIRSKEELNRVEAALYFHHYGELRSGWEEAAARHAGLSDEAEGQRGQLTVAEAGAEEHRVNLLALEKDLSESQESFYRLSGRIEVTENRIRHLEERLSDYRKEYERAGKDIIELETRLQDVAGSIEGMGRSLAETEESLAGTEPALEEYRRIEDEYESEINSRREEYNRARADFNDLSQVKRSLLEKISATDARLGGDEKFLSDYSAESSRLADMEAGLAEMKEQAESKLEESLGRLDGAAAKHADVAGEYGRCEGELEAETAAVEESIRRLTKLDGRLGYLKNVQEQGENLREGARKLYQLAASGPGSDGFVGVLGHLIQVDDPYRKAIEAVLADRLEAVLVDDEKRALSLAEQLREEGVGGATVVPCRSWPAGDVETAPCPEGSLGPAWKFVNAENGVSDLVRFLLRDVLLVNDIEEAMAQRRGLKGPVTFCTLGGDIIHGWGGVTVGGGGSSKEGVLGVAEEIKHLSAEAGEWRGRLEKSEGRLVVLKERVAGLKTSRDDLEREKFELERSIEALRAESERLEGEMAQVGSRRRTIDEDLDRRKGDREKDLLDLERLREDLKDCEERENSLSSKMEDWEKEYRKVEDSRQELKSRISGVEVARAASLEKKRSLEEAMSRMTAEKEDLNRRIDELVSFRAEAESRTGETGNSIEEQKKLLEELSEMGGRSGGEMEKLQDEHRKMVDELSGKSDEIKKLRASLDAVTGRLSSASVEMAELKTRMEETAARALAETDYDIRVAPGEDLADYISGPVEEIRERLHRLKTMMARIGPVNMAAVEEVDTLTERLTFLTTQKEDLEKAIESLNEAIRKINRSSRERFSETFEAVAEKFKDTFRMLFNGGEARLVMEEGVDLLEAGIIIYAQPPGKKMSKLNLLSGGEKAMTAISLLFALFAVRPAPFCLMDEVDAPLDDVNVERFMKLIDTTINGSQIVLITHNKRSMEKADNLVGVTMESPGVSKLVSVALSGSN